MKGNRALSVAHIEAGQFRVEQDRTVSRKELQQTCREAAQALELPTSIRIVLNELAAVWGEVEVNGRLVVWPSNDYLCDRTGLSERSLRYVLTKLIKLKLIAAKDSANGKRFSIRNKAGGIVEAFGFDLAPLYQRRDEFLALITERDHFRGCLKRIFDKITICKRVLEEALIASADAFLDAPRSAFEQRFAELRALTPRRSQKGDLPALQDLFDRWIKLREEVEAELLNTGNGGNDCRHIKTNNESIPICNKRNEEEIETSDLDFSTLERAVPAVKGWYGGRIETLADLHTAAEYLRPTIGAHPSAWSEATKLLGLTRASLVLLWVLQVYDDDQSSGRNTILNAGGYFRAMCRLTHDRKIKLEYELIQLANKRPLR